MNLKLRLKIVVAVLSLAVVASSQSVGKGPVFNPDGSLALPRGYRTWVFVGGPITPNGLNNGTAAFPEFHSVYVEMENYRAFQKNGSFPEGTVMVKELSLVQAGKVQLAKYPDGSIDSASGRGYFPGPLNGLDVMVKDSKRFSKTNNWGFFNFGHHAEPYEVTSKEASARECASCHIAFVSKTDMVWIQYYPLLSAKLD